jgi:hypothetical protein
LGFLEKLGKLLSPARPAERYHEFQVRCKRCSEILVGRVDLHNEPSLEYEDGKPIYFCRKVLVGSGPCYQQVETTFKFNESRKILERQAFGGEFIEEFTTGSPPAS